MAHPIPSTLGRRIAECRERLGWTQKALADAAKISVTFLSEVENDRRSPGAAILLQIANALGASLDYLLKGELAAAIPRRSLMVPPALAELAQEQGWSFADALDLLKAHELVVARRNRSASADEADRELSKREWLDLHRWLSDAASRPTSKGD